MSRIDDLARRLDELERAVRSRTPQAARTTIVGGAIDQVETVDTGMVDEFGLPIYTSRVMSRFGRQADGTNTMVVLDGPTPPAPTGLSVTPGPGTLTVRWSGMFAMGVPAPQDFYAVMVHLAQNDQLGQVVLPSPATLAGSVVAKDGDGITIGGLGPEPYTVVLVTVAQSGKWSDPSEAVTATPDDGSGLAAVAQLNIEVANAVTKATDAEALADGKAATYFNPDPPDGAAINLSVGDLWFDTNDKNKLYRWDGSAWQVAADQTAAEALSAAQNAQTAAGTAQTKADSAYNLAGSKVVTYAQTTAPAVNVSYSGDLWIDTDDGNRIYRFNGSNWINLRDGTIATAQQRADAAFSLAGTKGKVYSQGAAPDASSVPAPVAGDLWYDTTNITLKQYSGSAWSPVKMDGTQNLQVRTITASLLATEIVLTSKLVAGPVNDSHAEVSQDGVSMFQATPDGVVRSARLGSTAGDDFLQVYSRTDGQVVASIDQLGGVTAAQGRIGREAGDTFINGRKFEEYFYPLAQGIADWGERITNGSPTYSSEVKWMEVQTTLQSGRLYRVTLNPIYLVATANNTAALMYMRMTTGGAAVTINSEQIQSTRILLPYAGIAFTAAPMVKIINTASQVAPLLEYRFLVTYNSEGPGNANPVASGILPSSMTVEDLGPAKVQVGIDYGQSSPPVTKQNYTTYWRASASASYQGNGTKRTDVGQEMIHGYDPSGSNGNGCAIAVFRAGAYYSTNSSENGKLPEVALAGATITGVSFMLRPHHWYYNSGGTVFYIPSTYTIIPNTLANPGNNYWGYDGFAVGEAKYVAAAKEQFTAIILGQAPSTNLQYYGRFDGAGYTDAPVMRVSYTR